MCLSLSQSQGLRLLRASTGQMSCTPESQPDICPESKKSTGHFFTNKYQLIYLKKKSLVCCAGRMRQGHWKRKSFELRPTYGDLYLCGAEREKEKNLLSALSIFEPDNDRFCEKTIGLLSTSTRNRPDNREKSRTNVRKKGAI